MTAVLYAIPASHPCAAVEKALQLKGVPYRRVELIPVVHKPAQRRRFGATSVPALKFGDGTRVTGSRAIVRALEERVPLPPLLPAGGDERARVERAEEWGEQVLQPLVRRVLWAGLRRAPKAIESYSEGANLPVPRPLARASAPLVARISQRVNGATDANVRADLIGLGTHLGRVDGWIADGTLGGEHATAADLQIAASLRLLLTVEDIRPLLDDRPAGALARRWFPAYPGTVPAGTLPRDWIQAPGAVPSGGGASSPRSAA
jgi:glutathione S-transferase